MLGYFIFFFLYTFDDVRIAMLEPCFLHAAPALLHIERGGNLESRDWPPHSSCMMLRHCQTCLLSTMLWTTTHTREILIPEWETSWHTEVALSTRDFSAGPSPTEHKTSQRPFIFLCFFFSFPVYPISLVQNRHVQRAYIHERRRPRRRPGCCPSRSARRYRLHTFAAEALLRRAGITPSSRHQNHPKSCNCSCADPNCALWFGLERVAAQDSAVRSSRGPWRQDGTLCRFLDATAVCRPESCGKPHVDS